MAKPLPLLVGVLGIGATATGGVILMNRKGSGEGAGTSSGGTNTAQTGGSPSTPAAGSGGRGTGAQTQQAAQDLMFGDVASFKSKASTTPECLATDFTGLDLSLAEAKDFGSGQPETNKFFRTPSATPAPATKSCLIINWKKSQDANKKWTGKFTWLWTFMRGDEGFITFNVMEPGEGEKAKFTGVFYLVEKKSNEAKWEVKVKKEVETTPKEVEKANLDDYFPKAGEAIKTVSKGTKDYWDFMESKDKLGELCPDPTTCTQEPKVQKFQWTVSEASSEASDKSVKEWSSDLKWWENIYEVNNNWKLGEKLSDIKGKWASSSVPQESQ